MPRLRLIGCFRLEVGDGVVSVPPTSQRLLALLALRAQAESRGWLAGTLWPDKPDARASANLRTAVWRLPAALQGHVVAEPGSIGLGRDWRVDTHEAGRLAGRLHDGVTPSADETALFCADLLPQWDEDWLHAERVRFRQLRLHALDQLACNHLAAGRPDLSLAAALAALAVEPLRETAALRVLEVHLAEGNRAAAVGFYRQFAALLRDELGVAPGPSMEALMKGNGRVTPL